MLNAQHGVSMGSPLSPTLSQAGEGTKVHVFLSCRGAISFYVYMVPSGRISIFLDVECDKISCGLKSTRFFLNFL